MTMELFNRSPVVKTGLLIFPIALVLMALVGTPTLVASPLGDLANDNKHRVLVLHSYHAGYPWTDDIQRAVVDTLGKTGNIELHVEYLDLIRKSDPEHWTFLGELLRHKYGHNSAKFEVILVSDAKALDLVMQHREELFPKVPIVFCGINDMHAEALSEYELVAGVTGADETHAVGETLDLAMSLNPHAEQIAVVSGSCPTEHYKYRSFVQVVEQRFPEHSILHLVDLPEEQLLRQLQDLDQRSVVIYLSYILSPDGSSCGYQDALQMVVRNTTAMVFVTVDFLVRDGVVGGRVVDGYAQGQEASKIALRLIDGEAPDSIPFRQHRETRYVFDDRALQRFGVSDDVLPDRSILVNRRPDRLIESQPDDGLFSDAELFHMHGAVMLLVDSSSGTIVAANEAAYVFYGYPQLVGMDINRINTLSAEDAAAEMLSAELERKNYFAFRHRLSDDSVRDVAVYSYPIRQQETDLLFSVVFDRTEQLAAESAQERQTRIIISILVLLLVSAATGLLLLLKLFGQTRSAENVLRKHLRVRNSLMLEIQHRTKNNMQVVMGLISLQAAFAQNQETSEAYDRLHQRVSTIGLAHHRLVADGACSYVNLATYIHGVVDSASADAAVDGVLPRCFVEIPDLNILIDIAVPCGLIVNELISSSLRRLSAPDDEQQIRLQISELDDQVLELTYADTFTSSSNENTSTDPEEELGMLLVRELAEHQLGGSFTQSVSSNHGTQSIIRISRTIYKDRIPYESTGC